MANDTIYSIHGSYGYDIPTHKQHTVCLVPSSLPFQRFETAPRLPVLLFCDQSFPHLPGDRSYAPKTALIPRDSHVRVA